MNLTKLFDMQKVLDERIIKEKGLEGHDLLSKRILALQVELGELANEWRGFKFWSEDQEPRTVAERGACNGEGEEIYNPLLEEYVDCLHFILSIGLEIGYDNAGWASYPKVGSKNKSIVIKRFSDCIHWAGMMREDDYYRPLFQYFLDLGYLLGFTWEEIEREYYRKNNINHERQGSGY